MSAGLLFFALCVGHFIADYPLQGDFLSKAKNRAAPIPGAPWQQALGAHAAIHGGMVWLITGLWWLGLLEMVLHALIDDGKCVGRYGFNTDQALHLICKVSWTGLAIAAVALS